MHWIVLLLFCCPIFLHAQEAPEAKNTKLLHWVELQDGSRLHGTLLDKTITLKKAGAAAFPARIDGLWILERKDAASFLAHMRNGDKLHVELRGPALRFETKYGVLKLEYSSIQGIRAAGIRPLMEFSHRFKSEGGRIDFGRLPEINETSQLTFAGWFFSERLPGHQGLFSMKKDELHIMRSHFWHNNRIYVHLSDGDISYVSCEATVQRDKWFHIAIVYNGELAPDKRITIYQNGVASPLRHTGVIPKKTPDFGPARFVIPPEQFGFQGRIRLIQVYDSALSQADITRLARVPASK